MSKNYLYYKAINWNVIEDELDNATWERATSLFWLDTRIPIENDYTKWQALSEVEKEELNKALIILTNLSTYQSAEAEEFIRHSERSQQEVAIVNNLQFTEMVNTKAYNHILRVFNRNDNLVDSLFTWVDQSDLIRERLNRVNDIYHTKNAIQKRFMAVCIEGIMVYSQLSYLIYLWQNKTFANLGEILKMVILNESLHCLYLTHKIQLLLNEASPDDVQAFKTWAQDILTAILDTEEKIIKETYSEPDHRNLAHHLIRQEASHLAEVVKLDQTYDYDETVLAAINQLLAKLRKHDLRPQKVKSVRVQEDVMADSDYDF